MFEKEVNVLTVMSIREDEKEETIIHGSITANGLIHLLEDFPDDIPNELLAEIVYTIFNKIN